MKIYVAPKAAVLSMNVKENIASSSRITFNGTYYWNAGSGKVQTSDFLYTDYTGISSVINWLLDPTRTREYAAVQGELLEGCEVNPRPDAN